MFPSIRKCLALLPILAAAAALILSSVTAPRVHADGGGVDITGKPIQLHAARQDPLSGKITDQASPLDKLPDPAKQIFSTPLSAQMDQFWSGTAAPMICDEVSKLQGAGTGGFHAYDVTCSLAKTGKLSASQQGDRIVLSYSLPSNVIETYVTTPITCAPGHGTFLCPTDPKISFTVDVELQAAIIAPGPLCDLHVDPTPTVRFHNANLDSQDLTADIGKDLYTLWTLILNDDPVAALENNIDKVVLAQPLPLASQFASLTSAFCSGALSTSGDSWRLTASVDPAQGVVFQLLDVPPTPSLFRPMLIPEQPLVAAGGTLGLDGKDFPSKMTSVLITLDNGLMLGSATLNGDGTFSTTVTIPAGATAGSHTLHAGGSNLIPGLSGLLGTIHLVSDGPDATATVQVTAPASSGGKAAIAIVSSLGTILTSTQTDAPFTLSGTGFTPRHHVTVHLDSADGSSLGIATVAADGTFKGDFQGVTRSQAGQHTLVAVDGALQAQVSVTFVTPSVIN